MIYHSKILFPTFECRIPSHDRLDFEDILYDLDLDKDASKMAILQATRGRLANDSYSFEQPLRKEKDEKLHSSFFIYCMRYNNLSYKCDSVLIDIMLLNLYYYHDIIII